MRYLLFIAAGYCCGSILFAYILPKIFYDIDITKLSDDKNPGTHNAFRYGNKKVGTKVLILELLKGFLPVFIGAGFLDVNNNMFAVVMAAPVLGHAYPLYRHGRGGKAIAVSFGVLMGLYPIITPLSLLVLFYILFSCVICISPDSCKSIITFVCFGVSALLLCDSKAVAAGCIAITAIVLFRHYQKHVAENLEISLFRKRVI
ncbi:glycerol-3-phosphate acyltransferase [Anaerocolumna xylanovorans]|uniref:Glycerol-3-phosphate acyltransferase PlsY n=1 Tax=Anaerocolumna xylanovorans DSM 12503 TaxID=1121345 RepID=A0A1M7YN16_9FIRM|nr:glycerol-3-phosphate acyltransferase [Anaerocolumna xylanovorans]SHO54010.1 glycerol-3-phosphate acyltransferase PlsY [Anaerocolumna xylanovorans DSM 12503]